MKLDKKIKRDFYDSLLKRNVDYTDALKHAMLIAYDFIEDNSDPLKGWNEVILFCEAAKKKYVKEGV